MVTHLPPNAPAYLRSEQDTVDLFGEELARSEVEQLRAAHLDGARRVLGVTHATQADRFCLNVPIRAIVENAFALRARAIVLAHNHPGGDPSPSRSDYTMTRKLREVLGALDITLIDHVVFASAGRFSFRASGLL